MRVHKEKLLLAGLTTSIFCSGCLDRVKKIVTGMIQGSAAIVQGARDHIPASASKYGDPYMAPWPDPGFTSTPDYDTGHSEDTGDSYNAINPQTGIPEGVNIADVDGKALNSQLLPSEDTIIEVLRDSYDTFNQ